MAMLSESLVATDLVDGWVTGDDVATVLRDHGLDVEVVPMAEETGRTDFLRIVVPGSNGRLAGGDAPTTGVVGRLGGVGARPEAIGLVSDSDGAVAALSVALKLASMRERGDLLPGDVLIGTHVCPDAPTIPHEPVPFMGPPVDMATMNRMEVRDEMDVVLSIDATKGNRLVNHKGIAITPTVVDGWILPVAPDLLDIYEQVTARPPVVVPLSTYDVTPYGNGLYHINSILQPAVATVAPVVGVATTAATTVAGSGTGASHVEDVALAATFCLEVAKAVGAGRCRVYDATDFEVATSRYGSLARLRTPGEQ